ncbi:unnamed protein product [Adineta ricciae]|uniref:Endonuclease/exonuclease/phosphatase domain-containing protein n=2 Tax=Adineta ricciae TaxID=249248 RepID=A0A815U0S1_ADIRI|nr:unnamed protein product [Adineta ricciae]
MASHLGRTFRIATINVHGFRGGLRNQNNVKELVSILKPLNLDLLAVEEVHNGNDWTNFCTQLSLNHQIFNATYEDYHGNGFASRLPIKSPIVRPTNFLSPGGKRALLQCQLDGDHPFVQNRSFAVTHLDHVNEDARLAQMKYFRPDVDILIGDMNALTEDDYTESYYRRIVAGKREESQWEKPRFDLTKLITQSWGYQDAFRFANPKLKDEDVVTCAYGTRIDYIYLRPRENDPWRLAKCSIINTQPATDHNAIFAEFEQIDNEN